MKLPLPTRLEWEGEALLLRSSAGEVYHLLKMQLNIALLFVLFAVGRTGRLPRDRASQATIAPPLSPSKTPSRPPAPSYLGRVQG